MQKEPLIKVKKLKESAIVPKKAYEGDAGFDLFSLNKVVILPYTMYSFPLGIAIEFPDGYVAKVEDRSSMARSGLVSIGGIIDCQYRGEIHAQLINLSCNIITVQIGQRIAQLILYKCYTGRDIIEIERLSETMRGEKKFGSSGK